MAEVMTYLDFNLASLKPRIFAEKLLSTKMRK